MPRRQVQGVMKKKISIPMTVLARVELRLPQSFDRTKPAYAAFSKLVTYLLENWLREAEEFPERADAAVREIMNIPEGSLEQFPVSSVPPNFFNPPGDSQ